MSALGLAPLLAYPAKLARVDLVQTSIELDGIFARHGATSQATSPHVLFVQRSFPDAAMATKVYESDRISRATMSHVRAAPFFTSLVLTIHPKPEIEAPMLIVDLRVIPTGAVRAYLDVCGPSITKKSFATHFRTPLAHTLDAAVASAVTRRPVPSWIDGLSGGCGAQLQARAGRGSVVAHALVRYVERYLEGLASAPAAEDPKANLATLRTVRDTARANGRAGTYLARAFGAPAATRYLEVLWNES
ncbi:hypothetical protein BH09MYX1_BH09MYX1_05020 [soil metagenome]